MRIGLTGGIACGKSSVSALLAERGAVIIDSDVLAREAVAPGTWGLGAIVARFGHQVLHEDGSLNRERLGEIVFGDPLARRDLNAVVHPEVRRLAQAREAIAPPGSVVVHVIPLLVETGQGRWFDRVVVVDCSSRVQIKRLMARNDFTLDQAQARISAQADRRDRLALATDVINNDRSPMHLVNQVDNWWRRVVGAEPEKLAEVAPASEDAETPLPVDPVATVDEVPLVPKPRGIPNKASLVVSIILGLVFSLVALIVYQYFLGTWHRPGLVNGGPVPSHGTSQVSVGRGISMRLPAGWVVDKVDPTNESVSISHSSFQASYTAKVSSQPGLSAAEICTELAKAATAALQNADQKPATAPTPDVKGYDQAVCGAVGKRSGTEQYRGTRAFVSSRAKDGLTVSTVLMYNPSRVPATLDADVQELTASLVGSQYLHQP